MIKAFFSKPKFKIIQSSDFQSKNYLSPEDLFKKISDASTLQLVSRATATASVGIKTIRGLVIALRNSDSFGPGPKVIQSNSGYTVGVGGHPFKINSRATESPDDVVKPFLFPTKDVGDALFDVVDDINTDLVPITKDQSEAFKTVETRFNNVADELKRIQQSSISSEGVPAISNVAFWTGFAVGVEGALSLVSMGTTWAASAESSKITKGLAALKESVNLDCGTLSFKNCLSPNLKPKEILELTEIEHVTMLCDSPILWINDVKFSKTLNVSSTDYCYHGWSVSNFIISMYNDMNHNKFSALLNETSGKGVVLCCDQTMYNNENSAFDLIFYNLANRTWTITNDSETKAISMGNSCSDLSEVFINANNTNFFDQSVFVLGLIDTFCITI